DTEFSCIKEKERSLENNLSGVTLQANDENKDDYEDYDDDDDDDDDWDWKNSPGGNFTKRYAAMRTGNNQQANRQNTQKSEKLSTPSDKVLMKFEHKINLDKLNYADSVINKVTAIQRQREADMYRVKDKSDRATVEQ
ncbi:serine/threonine-protein kinase RIO1, partial [Tachysurus ichikawai]